MKALYCDRCGQYYHEKMPGYINQANISILDAETSEPEKRMDLCEECKKSYMNALIIMTLLRRNQKENQDRI